MAASLLAEPASLRPIRLAGIVQPPRQSGAGKLRAQTILTEPQPSCNLRAIVREQLKPAPIARRASKALAPSIREALSNINCSAVCWQGFRGGHTLNHFTILHEGCMPEPTSK